MKSKTRAQTKGQTASIDMLKKRSEMLKHCRAFFYARDVYEVDTPILSLSATPDVHLQSLKVNANLPGLVKNTPYYCHTSPEYAMKRLLSAGSGDIFYLGKVFRDQDLSSRHQPEFTMLEWYRLGFSMQDLITETADLIQTLFTRANLKQNEPLEIERLSYQQAFETYAGLPNIHQASAADCQASLASHNLPEIVGVDPDDKALWEQLVFTEIIEPQLGWQGNLPENRAKITCVYHYPARDAALSKISPTNPLVAERFEVFVMGMELANGYDELQEGDDYEMRFNESLQQRQALGYPCHPLDEDLLVALKDTPLPQCSGVALGFDRLLQRLFEKPDIQSVLPFAIQKP